MQSDDNNDDIKDLSYSQALSQLESIVANMRSDNCDIDTLSHATTRALALLKHCKAKLTKTDTEVKKCLEELSGIND